MPRSRDEIMRSVQQFWIAAEAAGWTRFAGKRLAFLVVRAYLNATRHSGGNLHAVDDLRHLTPTKHRNESRIVSWSGAGGSVTEAGRAEASDSAISVADSRAGLDCWRADNYYGARHFGVVLGSAPSGAVCSAAGYENAP